MVMISIDNVKRLSILTPCKDLTGKATILSVLLFPSLRQSYWWHRLVAQADVTYGHIPASAS